MFPDGAAALRYDFSGVGDISALSNAEARKSVELIERIYRSGEESAG